MHGHRKIRNADIKHITGSIGEDGSGVVSRDYETDNSESGTPQDAAAMHSSRFRSRGIKVDNLYEIGS